MSEQVQRRRVVADETHVDAPETAPQTSLSRDDVDAILDEIDAALQSDAEDYVRGFVQKGGQ